MNRLGLLFLLALVPFVQAKKWGDSCTLPPADNCMILDPNDPTDTITEWLVCKNVAGSSKCVCEDGMIHHDILGKCVAYQDKTCTIRNNDGMPWRPCTDYSQCFPTKLDEPPTQPRLEGTCHCDLNAVYDDLSKKCKLTHGATGCKAVTDCDVNALLTCQQSTNADGSNVNKCECIHGDRQTFVKYDANNRTCESLLHAPCEEGTGGWKDSKCHGPSHLKCENKTCVCVDGYASDKSGLVCALGYDKECKMENDECAHGFECTKVTEENVDKFLCRCPKGQEHHEGECVILAGHNCTADDGTELKCTTHATCFNSTCQCGDGYRTGTGDKCEGRYETVCVINGPTPCHSDSYLNCTKVNEEEKCLCLDKYNWDATDDVCKGQYDMPCREDVHCAGDTVCTANKCSCRAGFVPEGTACKGVYDTACANDGECSTAKFLICNTESKKCDCKDPDNNFRAGDSNDFCSAKAGRACGGDNPACAPGNATCNTANVCGCADNHEANMDGWCVPRTGGGGDDGAGSLVASSLLVALVLLVNKL